MAETKKKPAKKGSAAKGTKKSAAPKKGANTKKVPAKGGAARGPAKKGKKAAANAPLAHAATPAGSGVLGKATLGNARISPRKARLVVDLIKGKQVEPALQMLQFSPKKGARMVEKLLRSALSNAIERNSADVDKLWVTGGWVGAGRTLRRLMPRAQGRGDIIRKRSSHITLELGERR